MLDIKFIRENKETVKTSIKNRNLAIDIDGLLKLDAERRTLLLKIEELRAKKNKANDEITALLKDKKNPKEKIEQMKGISQESKSLEDNLRQIGSQIDSLVLTIPNIPHESVPVGDVSKKEVVRTWGTPKKFDTFATRKPRPKGRDSGGSLSINPEPVEWVDFPLRTHLELAEHLDIIDFARAAKITGSNFVLFKREGARLERALFNFMLDLHTKKHGYTEIFPPFLVNRASMTGTGQLPKLEEDMYRLKDEDLFLIPTAEVPVTNIHRDEVISEELLPIYYTAYTACFRREAGSYGKDTKGLIRVHQFDKVELVKFVRPETSFDELEKLVANAEEVLQLLGLPYRVVVLPTEDLSFSASKCYDLEAYSAGLDTWLEVSSCSNFTDFQARRANIRWRTKDGKKVSFVHTLNGSGVALARTVIAILENYQQADGSVVIPEVLRPYMDGRERIGK